MKNIRIRQLTLLLTIGTLSAVSCSKEYNAEAISISQKPIVLSARSNATRSIVTDGALPSTYTIYASAYFTNLTETRNSGNYFVSKPFNYNGENWVSDPSVFWPLGGYVDFLFLSSEDGELDITECTEWNTNNCSTGAVVSVEDDKCLTSEILYGSSLNRNSQQRTVSAILNHTQSWIEFVINCDAELVRIDNITLKNAYTGGTLRIDNNGYTDIKWSFNGHRKKDIVVPGSENLVPEYKSPAKCNILLPEQEACDIVVEYRLRNKKTDSWETAIRDSYHYAASVNPWFSARKTVYTIDFKYNEIKITTSVEDWVNEIQSVEAIETPATVNGVFTVNDSGKKVKFAKGNLYWNGSKFRCEEHQYDFPTTREPDHIGHFFWSKDASIARAHAYKDPSADCTDTFFAADGGAIEGFTVLSIDEIEYLIENALTVNSFGFYWFDIDDTPCVVLKPDGFSGTVKDSYTAEKWAIAEDSGLVALPIAGFFYEDEEDFNEGIGFYWSSTPYADYAPHAWYAFLFEDITFWDQDTRNTAFSVRLVSVQ